MSARARSLLALPPLLAAVVALQALLAVRMQASAASGGSLLYVRSGEFLKRAALSYDSLLADVYWIRTLQHYGRTRLSTAPDRQYDLLYPLLDLTTSLDPLFNIAYRFGAVFLAEEFPDGAGRPDLAIALLEKGLRAQPDRWEFVQDIGFVHYWWRQDYDAAAAWFRRASEMRGAPAWLAGLAAVTLAQGGNRESSRRLWQEVLDRSGAEFLRAQAVFRLKQLDAMDTIAALEAAASAYRARTGALPASWQDLQRAGLIPGVPVDPDGHPFALEADGRIGLAPGSTVNPLPRPERVR